MTVALTEPEPKRLKLEQPDGVPDTCESELLDATLKDSNTASDPQQVVDCPSVKMVYKLKIENLKKFVNGKEVKKFCEKQANLVNVRIKKAPEWTHAYLSFDSLQEQKEANEKLTGKVFRNLELKLSMEEPCPQRPAFQREEKDPADDTRTPFERLSDQVTPLWRVEYSEQLVQKYAIMQKTMRKMNKKIKDAYYNRDIDPKNRQALQWIVAASRENQQMPCPLEETIASPLQSFYRNKCEFTFGVDMDGEKSLGFLLGMFKQGVTSVMHPQECLHVTEASKKVVNALIEYLKTSELPVYDRVEKKGYWRLVQVRTQSTGQVMVIIQVNSEDLLENSMKEAQVEAIKQFLLSKVDLKEIEMTTLFIQDSNGSFNGITDQSPMKLLYGPGHVYEKLLGLQFRISPTSFFQVNTPATELLYGHVRDLCFKNSVEQKNIVLEGEIKEGSVVQPMDVQGSKEDLVGVIVEPEQGHTLATQEQDQTSATQEQGNLVDNVAQGASTALHESLANIVKPTKTKTLVLDLCCGTGTIGQVVASQVDKVIGIEMIHEAIEDAQVNAQLNGLDNIEYYCEKVEKVIKKAIKSFQGEPTEHTSVPSSDKVQEFETPQEALSTPQEPLDVIAILDPPRAGVHADVIKTIRNCELINKVIYISCDADAAFTNFVDLTRASSKKLYGNPFRPMKATPFDLFPHTKHCELVIEFERVAPESSAEK